MENKPKGQTLSFYQCIGKYYENGWYSNCNARYRVFKGARNTKKSVNMLGYEIIAKILSDPRRNILIIRNVSASHNDTTVPNLLGIINQPNFFDNSISLAHLFTYNKTTHTITRKATGQKIVFEGMNNPYKITGFKTQVGFLTDIYFEEAFELKSYDDFRKVDGTMRGKLPKGLFLQVTFLMNGWDGDHWINEKFFKPYMADNLDELLEKGFQEYYDPNYQGDFGRGLYLHTSSYTVNEFRDKDIWDKSAEHMRNHAPDIWKVEYMGMWGNTSGATYPEMTSSLIKPRAEINKMPLDCFTIGIDTGLSDGEGKIKRGDQRDIKNRLRSATTMQMVGLSADYVNLVAIDEFFHSNENVEIKKTEPELVKDIVKCLKDWQLKYAMHPVIMKGKILVYIDNADIGFRQSLELEAKAQGFRVNSEIYFIASTKTRKHQRVAFIRHLMAWGEFQISEACPNLAREIRNSKIDTANGNIREDFDDHCINANEYAWIPIMNKIRRRQDFKDR